MSVASVFGAFDVAGPNIMAARGEGASSDTARFAADENSKPLRRNWLTSNRVASGRN
ncbi:hypothetical protein [Mesorhizobium sp. 1M-11]|uniref:hypothetical protein n=1 Tax=Mesorhizobium sp. 1M-11 TaxID=1529006 RepID=UPI00329946C2